MGMKKLIILVFIVLAGRVLVQAQVLADSSSTTLTGKVFDDKRHAIEFATVMLLAADSSFIKGAITDTTGTFELVGIRAGQYFVKISNMGSKAFISSILEVKNGSSSLSIGEFILESEARNLQEVVVKGERPLLEREYGKLIVNVANSAVFKTSTNAIDVLKRSPSLIVDPSGGISIKGLYAPLVMLDGRPQPLSAEELRNIPASDIEKVEIVSNASARFEGEIRAVINIKLKRDKNLGWTGVAYGGFNQNRHFSGYEAGISATYKTRQWTYFGVMSHRNDNDFLNMSGFRRIGQGNNYTLMTPNAFIHYDSKPVTYRVGADYQINSKNTIGIIAKGVFRNRTDLSDNLTHLDTYAQNIITARQNIQTLNQNTIKGPTRSVNLNYRGTLSPKNNQLTVDLDYGKYSRTENQDIQNRFLNNDNSNVISTSRLMGDGTSELSIRSIRADYTHPLSKTLQLAAGTKLSWVNSDDALRYDTLALGGWGYDASKSNRFRYNEQISAAYVILGKEWKKFTIEAGLRLEHTQTRGNSLTLSSVVDRSYLRWLPSFQASYRIDDNQNISLGYARKLTRPSFSDLNPFTFYTDPFTYIEGNPFLLPTMRNTAELSYSYKNFNAGLSYVHDTDIIVQMPIQDDATKIIRYTRINLNTQNVFNIDLSLPVKITKFWSLQNNLLIMHRQVASSFLTGQFDNRIWTYYYGGGQYFSLKNNCTIELSYYYQGPSADQFYRVKSYGVVSLGVQKSFWANKLTAQLNFNDLFNTYREAFYGQFLNVDVNTLQTRNVQNFSMRLTYKFGKSTFKRRNRTNGSAEEESRTR